MVTAVGPDMAVAWWAFWLVTGLVIFCGLVWAVYRLAVWSDQAIWLEHHRERPHPADLTADRERWRSGPCSPWPPSRSWWRPPTWSPPA